MEVKDGSTDVKKAREEVQEVDLIRAERVGRAELKQEIGTIQGRGGEKAHVVRGQTGLRKDKDMGRVGGHERREVRLTQRKGWWWWLGAHIDLSCLNKQVKAHQHEMKSPLK